MRRWNDSEQSVDNLLIKPESLGFDFILYGSWARKSILERYLLSGGRHIFFNNPVEGLIKLLFEHDVVLIQHGQSAPDFALSKFVLDEGIKNDYVYPGYLFLKLDFIQTGGNYEVLL
ncbi:hypothetical protein QWZ04_02120 [Vibrio tapetis subsp. quintayensis]|uniref:hypothetical protein n=1 Tax=Vibrio tapetis TaxID=52443 RepID=UPI0025B2DD9C|nr:hypothetical protein [Vibrio tapetis]MDN3679123.1 hypothetical protein [Vibrio tapetis subsp. quintayensis]